MKHLILPLPPLLLPVVTSCLPASVHPSAHCGDHMTKTNVYTGQALC